MILIIYFVLFSFIFFYINEFLSFGCGLISGTLCLFIFDVLHHHLALGFLIIFLTTILNQFKNCVLYRLLNYVQRFTFTYSVIDSGIESYYSKLSLFLSVFGSLTSFPTIFFHKLSLARLLPFWHAIVALAGRGLRANGVGITNIPATRLYSPRPGTNRGE